MGLNIQLSNNSSGESGFFYRGSKSATILHRELQHWPKEGTNERAFRDANQILPPKPHSDCSVLFGLVTPKRNSGKVQTESSNMKFSDLCGCSVIWSICRDCYLLTSLLCKRHLFKSLFTFFKSTFSEVSLPFSRLVSAAHLGPFDFPVLSDHGKGPKRNWIKGSNNILKNPSGSCLYLSFGDLSGFPVLF